jgi:hypothetical protein
MFLWAILTLEPRAESLASPDSSLAATEIPGPSLKLTSAKSRANGAIEFQVDSTDEFKVLIQSSYDLTNWDFVSLAAPHTPVVFTNQNGPEARQFYRAADFTLSIQGTIRDIQTDLPVAVAKVTISDFSLQPLAVTQTDADGLFHVVVSREHNVRKITVEKEGYDLLTTEPVIYSDASSFQMPLWLARPRYRPPNDDFQNRASIEGTNVVIRTRTFVATSEPGHELDIFYVDVSEFYRRNLWWTWTAPMDGAVRIELERAPVSGGSGAAVYTGATLQELVGVWDTGMNFWDDAHAENPFLVKQGVQYHIAFGTVWPAETAFTLRMVVPETPVPYVGGDVKPFKVLGESLSLYARANGVWPVTFQWRKDGVDIPNSTNASFYWRSLELQDAGAYSVRVANAVGTTISDEIHVTVIEKRPTAQEILQGTWTQETSQGPLLITFADGQFTAKRPSDNSSAGRGHYTISEEGTTYQYRLVMTYTEPLPETVRYFRVALSSLDAAVYQEWDENWTTPHFDEVGAFTRLSPP